ncbi:MAG: FAD-dependent oxidoreductase, partial [Thermoprotei archaeon]
MITMYDFDVIVVGGGFSGVAAAIGSSRLGVKTLLVEKSGVLGGTPILSLVNPFMRWRTNGKDVVKGVFKEILDRLKAKSEWGFSSIFDPEILKDTLFEIVIKNNVDLMLYSTVIDVEGKNIIIYSRGKKWRVEGKIIVDATGDGDIAYIMGADFMYGRDKDGRVQPVTLMFRVGGINFLEM